jgi:hypothetical protein
VEKVAFRTEDSPYLQTVVPSRKSKPNTFEIVPPDEGPKDGKTPVVVGGYCCEAKLQENWAMSSVVLSVTIQFENGVVLGMSIYVCVRSIGSTTCSEKFDAIAHW